MVISKSYWFLGVYLFFMQTLHGQNPENERFLNEYNAWLKQGSVGQLFEAGNVSIIGGIWQLDITSKEEFSDPKRMALTWPYLVEEYEGLGLSLPEQLLIKWVRVSGQSSDSVHVNIICAGETAFKVQILREAGTVKIVENINSERDVGVLPYGEVWAVRVSNPGTCIVTKAKSKTILDELIPALKQFFTPKERKEEFRFDHIPNNNGTITLQASGLKKVITTNYNEKLTVELSWVEHDGNMTQLCYELSAEFGSGILRSGKYQDVKQDYAPELLSFYEKLRRFISKKLANE